MIRASMLALALALSAGATRADDLTEVVDRYVAWRGGAAFERLQTIHQRGTVEASGLHGTSDIWASRDGRQRIDIDLGVFKQTQVLAPDSEQSWDTNASGQVETMPKAGFDALRHGLTLEFADTVRGRGGAKATLLGVEERDGASWSVVRLSFGDADTYDLFIDPKSGALDGFRITEDRQTRFERQTDWRVVDGVRMPFEDDVTTGAPGGDQKIRAETIELNQAVPDKLLARPGATHKASFRNGASSTDWIPFELFGGHIFFPAKVNGHDLDVLLDSGAQITVIDKTVAQSIGLTPKGSAEMTGSSGAEAVGIVDGVTVEVGNLKLSDVTAASVDLRSQAKVAGHAFPFVLGDELFSEVAVDIDFANRRIAFRDPAHLARPEGAAEVPLTAVLALRSIPVSIDGAPPVQATLDLGSALPLMVFPSYAKAHGMPGGRRTSQRLGSGIGGMLGETIATVGKVEVAGVAFTDVPTIFPADTISAANSNQISGNIGLPMLSRFHLVIDFSHDRMWMAPEPHANALLPKDRLGLFLMLEDGAIEIKFVSPGSPAQTAGLKPGDRIHRINRKPASAWSRDTLTRLGEEAAGTHVDLTMADGKVRRLVLKDYF